MTFDEYFKRMELVNKLMCIFISADVIILIIGWVIDGCINRATTPNPVISIIMIGIMIIHGFGSMVLDKELEKDYEANKID